MGKTPPHKSMALGLTDSNTPSDDALSALPESIIHRIFSFLEPNQTVRLSLISKKFNRLCLKTPYLYLSADFDSSKNCSTRYSDFIKYVDNFMKLRGRLGIGVDRFLFHWYCKQSQFNVGINILDSCLRRVTVSNVRELDILVYFNFWNAGIYALPLCVCECQSLRVLKLNLQMGKFCLELRKMDFVEVFLLDSVHISDAKFGQKLSFFWTSLRRLNLNNVKFNYDIDNVNSSLEELELSKCEIVGMCFSDWLLDIGSLSLKSLSISRCHFKSRCRIVLDCPSLMNFSVFGSDFDMSSTFEIVSQSLDNFAICSSNFSKACALGLSCPSIKQISINGCKYNELCCLKMDSLSLDALTVSDCEFIYPDQKPYQSGCPRRINVFAQRLETLTINSSDKYSYKFPLYINARSLQAIVWKGNPVDFSYLKSFESLENAIIHIQPSCKHKSEKLACHCKRFMASIYSVAMLLESLKDVKSLEINLWPIELFFMQNDEPVIFKNLLHLCILVNDLSADQLSVIASFVKGLPKLITLVIKFEKKSALCDPDLVNLLGLCPEAFSASLSEDSEQLKITKGNQGVQMVIL